MNRQQWNCKFLAYSGCTCSVKRIARTVFALCLGMTVCALVIGVFTLSSFSPANKRLHISISRVKSALLPWDVIGNKTRIRNAGLNSNSSSSNDNNSSDSSISKKAEKVDEDANSSSNTIFRAKGGPSLFLANSRKLIQEIPFEPTYRESLIAGVERREKTRTRDWRHKETQYTSDTQFLKYMKCSTSVRKKLLEAPYVRQRFVPEVPILMWSEHFSREEYDRLSQYHSIFGWQVAEAADVIASALGLLNTSSNTYMFDNDRSPEQGGCTTCAIIGNGGILNGSKKGKEIDAHQYVFRVNVALTKGHEEDVGTKTSFYCAAFRSLSNSLRSGNPFGFKAPPYQKGIRYVFFPKTKWAYMYLDAVLRGKPGPRNPEDGRGPPIFQTALRPEDIKLVHPDFERYLKFRWVDSTRTHLQVYRPSTGAIMLLLALHTCDQVDVYGFAGSFQNYSEYYYDTTFRKHRNYINHDSVVEKALWIKLHELGLINLYQRE